MKHTRQIIRYTALTAAAVIAACALAGCTRSDTSTNNNSAGSGNSSGNVVAGAGEKVESTGAAVQETGSPQADSASAQENTQNTAAAQESGQTVQGTAAQQGSGSSQTQETAASGQVSSETSSDNDEDVYDGQETFTGYYEKPDGTESVNIVLVNDNAIQFSFSNSHISATADVDGDTAVYHGDDDYTITFTVADDELGVAVSGADADESSMNGIYYRSTDEEASGDYIDVDAEDDTEDDGSFSVSDSLDAG